jgi:hypothetical protein
MSRAIGDVNDSESLAGAVTKLADMIGPEGSPGRQAFVNYAERNYRHVQRRRGSV